MVLPLDTVKAQTRPLKAASTASDLKMILEPIEAKLFQTEQVMVKLL